MQSLKKKSELYFTNNQVKNILLDIVKNRFSASIIVFGSSLLYKINLLNSFKSYLESNGEKVEEISMLDQISIEKLRNIIKYVNLRSDRLRFIILNGDNLSVLSYNTLLKTLEEIPNRTFFFILKTDTNVIPTVLSRSLKLIMEPSIDELLSYLVKVYNYPINWAKFVCLALLNNLDLIKYFSDKLWDISNRKPNSVFQTLLDFFLKPSKKTALSDDIWVKNFDSFTSFKVLLRLVESFLKDLFLYQKFFKNSVDNNNLNFINFIYSNIVKDMNEKFYLYPFISYKDISDFLLKFSKINHILFFKKVNKRILYVNFFYKLYCLLKGEKV